MLFCVLLLCAEVCSVKLCYVTFSFVLCFVLCYVLKFCVVFCFVFDCFMLCFNLLCVVLIDIMFCFTLLCVVLINIAKIFNHSKLDIYYCHFQLVGLAEPSVTQGLKPIFLTEIVSGAWHHQITWSSWCYFFHLNNLICSVSVSKNNF